MNTTADECGMGMYLMENEVNPILPENHPNKLIPVMIRIMNNSKSFLLMIREKDDFMISMITFPC